MVPVTVKIENRESRDLFVGTPHIQDTVPSGELGKFFVSIEMPVLPGI